MPNLKDTSSLALRTTCAEDGTETKASIRTHPMPNCIPRRKLSLHTGPLLVIDFGWGTNSKPVRNEACGKSVAMKTLPTTYSPRLSSFSGARDTSKHLDRKSGGQG